jgi:hypothetical protein
MQSTIRRWHRALVDRIADWPWLRGRAGADAAWTHYERHARAATAAADRHARAKASARDRAARLHARSASAASRIAERRPPRVLKRFQERLTRPADRAGTRAPEEGSGE